MKLTWIVIFSAALIGCVFGSGAVAQVGPVMFALPWENKTSFESRGSLTILGNSHLRNTDDNFQMVVNKSQGRWRILGDRRESPVIGYEVTQVDIDTTNKALPEDLINATVSAGSPVALINKEWFVIAIAGVGYAGTSPFSDPHAWYGQGTLLVGKIFTPKKSLIFGLDYDGNRSIFPDIPLPGFAYRDVYNIKLNYVIGLPLSGIEYTPDEHWTIKAGFLIPRRFEGSIEYKPIDELAIYADYSDRTEAYHLPDDPGTRRMFFSQQRVECGVNYYLWDNLRLTLAGGYAFSQNFSYGFSNSDSEVREKPADEPYIRFAVLGRF